MPKAVSLDTPEDSCHYVWLYGLVDRVLSEVEQDCRKGGLSTYWSVSVGRVIEPSLGNAPAPPLTETCEKYSIENEKTASNMPITVNRRFQEAFGKHVRSTVTALEATEEVTYGQCPFCIGADNKHQQRLPFHPDVRGRGAFRYKKSLFHLWIQGTRVCPREACP